MLSTSRLLAGFAVLALLAPAPQAAARKIAGSAATQPSLLRQAEALGATEVTVHPAPDGGTRLNGELGGAQFAISIPAGWTGDGLLYAHGYTTPGTPVAVADDPVAKGTKLLGQAYGEGLAVGHSAYDKDGLGVETGVRNTTRLRDFLTALGGKRVYLLGDSMGGGIVVAALEKHPGKFAGGLARCGVVDSWQTLLGQIVDMRLAYNALTQGTPYALPGEQDVRHDAIDPRPPVGTNDAAAQAYVFGQIAKVGLPPLALWAAAQQDPDGPEARIAHQVTMIGGFDYDAAALAFPLVTAALGADDMAATAGGWVYGNVGKPYSAPGMTAEEEAALNGNIQRVAEAPAATAYLANWHEATGRITVPLVTLHNRIDSLVPYAQEEALAHKVAQAGNAHWLVSYAVPPTRAALPIGGVEGYTHCGFSDAQNSAAWAALRRWAETGDRPAEDLIQ